MEWTTTLGFVATTSWRVMWVIILIAVILQGLRKIQNDPLHNAILTIFGRMVPWFTLKEGWKLLLGYPFLLGAIPIDVRKKNRDFNVTNVRTPQDQAELKVKVSLTVRPDPEKLTKWHHSGGEEGVFNVLGDAVEEATQVRISGDVWPLDWIQAQGAGEQISQDICAKLTADNISEEMIAELQRGNGNLRIPELGAIVSKVNTKIEVVGDLAKEAELKAREEVQKNAELVEFQGIKQKMDILSPDAKISPELAAEIVQTERKKVTKDIKEHKIDLSPGAASLLEAIIGRLLGR